MKLSSIVLENFRCFKHLTLTLHPELTVLVARNGAGKTTVLDAARIAVWPFVKAFDLGSQTGKSATIQIEDVRLCPHLDGNMEAAIPSKITTQGDWGSCLEKKWEQGREKIKAGTNTIYDRETKNLTKYGEGLQGQVRQQNNSVNLPLIVYLGTGRLWYQGRYTSVVADKKLDDSMYSRLWGYQNCLTASSSYKQFEDWYGWIYRSYRELQIKGLESGQHEIDSRLKQFSDAIAVVKSAVNEVTEDATGWRNIEYSATHHQQIVLSHQEYGVLPLSMLSDGLRNIVVLVSDIAFRCIKLNPHLGSEAAIKTAGVVMIDEVDMFLHPSWQQTIIGSLRKAFPEIQFIVTTHSPQVLSSVPSECIRILSDGDVYSAPKGSQGAESKRLLERIFFVDSRYQKDENTQLLLAYEKLVYEDKWESDDAVQKRQQLDEIFGQEEPKLTELDLYIENRAWELDIEKNK